MKQQKLFEDKQLLFHGGELALGRRKSLRPIDPRRSVHVTLKAGRRDLRRKETWIETEAWRAARRFHARIYELAVNDDHIHFVVKVASRRLWHAFIRMLSSALSLAFGEGLFTLLPFTRILNWGRDFRTACGYVRQNREEASGKRPYEKRRDWYKRWRKSGKKSAKKSEPGNESKDGPPG